MKKVISIILCAILVLGMAVNAFAATSNDPTQIPGNWNPVPNKPAPSNPIPVTFNPAPMNSDPKDNPGVKDILPEEDEIEDEIEDENPNTGAPALEVIAVVTAAGCVSFIKKRK